MADTVAEGSRHNMRTKHQLNFDDAHKVADLVALAAAAANSAASAGLGPGSSGSGVAPSSSATGFGRLGEQSSSAGPSGGMMERGGGGQPPSPNRIPPPTTYPTKGDEQLHGFVGPLATLRASLDSHSDLDSDTLIASAFPRSIESEPERSDTSSPSELPCTIGVTLAEVEQAYVDLTTALVRLPATLKFAAKTLAPLNRHAAVLRRCFLRELTNLTTGPRTSIVIDVMGSGRKKGLSGDQMRRQRDEVAAAQTAIKAFAALTRHDAACAVFSVADINEVVTLLLSLPTSTALAGLARKEVLPFVSFFIAAQRLPASVLDPFFSKIVIGVKEMLAVYDSKGRHDRNNMNEALAAIGQMFATHSGRMLGCWREWLGPVLEGVWDGPKKAISVRTRALTTLGAVAQALVTSPSSHDSAEATRAASQRDSRNKEIALAMIELLHSPVPNDQIYARDPIARDATDGATKMTLLAEQLVPFSPTPTDDTRVKPDDAPWLAIVQLLALLPVLMEQRFRRLQQRGIRPWISLFSAALGRPIPHVRTLAVLAWPHLLYGFLRVPPDAGPPGGRLEGDSGRVAWIFREDGKPFGLLNNVFSAENKKCWLAPSGQSTPTSRVRTRALALPLMHTLVSSIYGITVLVHNGPAVAGQAVRAVEPNAAQLGALTQVWNRLVVLHLVSALRATYDDVRGLAWATLAAIVKPASVDGAQACLERLVNPVFLDGSILATKAPMGQTLLAARALGATVTPAEVPGWSTRWTVANLDKLLALVDELIGTDSAAITSMEKSIVPFWRNLMAAIHVERKTVEGVAATAAVVDWLLAKIRSDVSALYVLGSTLAAATIQVLVEAMTSPIDDAAEARAITIVQAVFDSTFAFSTEHSVAFGHAAGQVLDAVHSTPVGWAVLELGLAAFDAHVISSKQAVAVRASLAGLWANLLADADAADVEFTEARLQSVVKLVNIYLRSAEASAIDAPWTALASCLARLAFGIESAGSKQRREFLTALLAPPSAATADVRLMSYLLLGANVVALTKKGRASLLKLSTNAIHLLFCAPLGGWIDVLRRMLDAAGSLDVDLYCAVLKNIADVAEPTSADLAKYAPLLGPVFARTCEASQEDAGQEQTQASQARADLTTQAAGALRDCYAAVWDQTEEPLEIPEELMDLLVSLKRNSVGLRVKDLVDTQQQDQQDVLLTSVAEPVPGQRLKTPATVRSSATTVKPRTSGYEGDISARRAKGDFPTVPSSSTNPDPSNVSLAEPSASLAAPPAVDEPTQVADDADLSTFLEDTPREVDRERTRSSLFAMATDQQDEVEQVADAGPSGTQDVLDLDSGDWMTLPVKQRKRKRAAAANIPPSPTDTSANQPTSPKPSPSLRAAPLTSPRPDEASGSPRKKLQPTQSAASAASSSRSASGASPTKKPRMTAWVEVPVPTRKDAPHPRPDKLMQLTTPVRALSPKVARSVALPVILPDTQQSKQSAKSKKRKAQDMAAEASTSVSVEAEPRPQKRRGRSSAVSKPRSEAIRRDSEGPTAPREAVGTPELGRKPSGRKAAKQARRESKRQAQLERSPSVVPSTQSDAPSPSPARSQASASSSSPASPSARAAAEAEELVRKLLALGADAAATALRAVDGSRGVQQFLRIAKTAGGWFGGAVAPSVSSGGVEVDAGVGPSEGEEWSPQESVAARAKRGRKQKRRVAA